MGEAKNQKLNLDAAQLVACNVKGNRFTETKIFTNQYALCRESCSDFLTLR
jgi:hypothetical protein